MGEDQVGGIILGVTACALGPLVHWVTGAAADGRLPLNIWAGLRTARTMASDESWVTAHRAARAWTRRTALESLTLGLVTIGLAMSGSANAALVTGLLALVGVVLGLLLAVRAAHRALG